MNNMAEVFDSARLRSLPFWKYVQSIQVEGDTVNFYVAYVYKEGSFKGRTFTEIITGSVHPSPHRHKWWFKLFRQNQYSVLEALNAAVEIAQNTHRWLQKQEQAEMEATHAAIAALEIKLIEEAL